MIEDTNRTQQIGQRIRQRRKALGLSLADLATRSGHLTKSRISNYEQGLRRPSLETAEQLAELLDLDVVWLLGIKQEGKA